MTQAISTLAKTSKQQHEVFSIVMHTSQRPLFIQMLQNI
jgi:hypothetical protein